MISSSLLILLFSALTALAQQEKNFFQMASYIKDNPDVQCSWVNKVGDTQADAKVQMVGLPTGCIDGKGPTNGICQGTIRCTGIGNGWGDIYFENVSCLGSNIGGKAVCGLSERDVEGKRGLATGVKSCVNAYLQGYNLKTLPNSENQVISPKSPSLEVTQ